MGAVCHRFLGFDSSRFFQNIEEGQPQYPGKPFGKVRNEEWVPIAWNIGHPHWSQLEIPPGYQMR